MKKKSFIISVFILMLYVGITIAAPIAMWDAPTTGGPVDGYRIYYYPHSDPGNISFVDTQSKVETYDLETIKNTLPYDVQYDFYVTAYNDAGESGPSNIQSYVRPLEPPGGCTNFRL